jgi:hypothetical protein
MIATVERFVLAMIVAGVVMSGCASGGHPSARATAATSSPPLVSSSAPTNAATSTSGGDTNVEVYGNCRSPKFEPPQIVLACADYGELLTSLRWTSWTAKMATATGTFRYNDCTPDCANGHFHDVRSVQVALTTAVRGASGALVWSRVHIHPTPDHFPTVESLPVRPI